MNKEKEYWSKRKDLDESFLKYERRQLKRNAKLYDKVILETSKDVKAFYLDYGHDSVVTYSDAIQPIKNRANFSKMVKEELEAVKKSKDFTYKNLLKELSERKKVSRLDALTFGINKNAHGLAEELNQSASEYLAGSYERSYGYQTKTLNELAGKEFNGALYKTRVEKAVFSEYNGKSFSSRIWSSKDTMTNTLRSTLQEMFIKQQHVGNAVEEMAKRFNVNKSSAERIIRTEGARITEEATRQSYAEHGIEKYMYNAVNDERTSPICEELDGKVFLLSEAQSGVNYPPMHPNCRSTTTPVF